MKVLKPLLYSVLLFTGVAFVTACFQNESKKPPFWDEIQNFKKADSLKLPPPNGILFVGSSSFRLWSELETVFKDYNAINRGFGGANLIDINYYANDIIFPYKPRQIIIYCGDNDLPADTVDAPMLFGRFKTFYTTIRNRMPDVPIAYISIKPSPQRERYLPIVKEANHLIKSFLQTQPKAEFIDVFSPMLTPDGKFRPELYKEDSLHMNSKGYDIWIKAITPYLIKNKL